MVRSGLKKVTSGIPQRSVHGPTLFIIYINNLPECIETQVKLFIDDSLQVNTDVLVLVAWSREWLLSLNEAK